jgi:AraC-like DNA-binding protein
MFFQSFKTLKILDIFQVKREKRNGVSSGRSWTALSLRLSGSSKFITQDKTYTASEGSILYIPEGISFTKIGEKEELIVLRLKCFDDEGSEMEVYNPKNASFALNAFTAILKEWNDKKSGYQNRCTSMLYSMMSELCIQINAALPPYKSAMIAPGVKLIDSDFSDPYLSVSTAAKACNISEEYFRKLYKEEHGISPHNAITEMRLQKACRLLESGFYSISEIAERCGFLNTKYFSTLFKERLGMTPRDYRNLYI